MFSSLSLVVLVATALCVVLLVTLRGRWGASMVGGLLFSIPTYCVVGLALAGHVDPLKTRFQPYPFTSISDHVSNVVFWGLVWGVTLLFVLPKLGKRWRASGPATPEV
jgi:hypothetical protein